MKGLAVLTMLAALASAAADEPIPTTSNWYVLGKARADPDFDLYRRYAVLQDADQPFPNVLIINCARGDTYFTHFTVELPRAFALKSFARGSWFPKLTARFVADGGAPFTMEGEYRDGEFFFDDRPDQHDGFQRALAARNLSIAFGDKNDTIVFAVLDTMNAVMDGVLKDAGADATGTVESYDPATAYKRCKI